MRPGWFDAGDSSADHIDLRQGDRVDYGPVRRTHVAEVITAALATPEAERRTVEVFSSAGTAVSDWRAAFGALAADEPGSLDGIADAATLPVEQEPDRVRADLERWQ